LSKLEKALENQLRQNSVKKLNTAEMAKKIKSACDIPTSMKVPSSTTLRTIVSLFA
jgi:hypothetical protein